MKYSEFLPYEFKTKIRQSKAMLKNYWAVLITICSLAAYLIYNFVNILLHNLQIINRYDGYIFTFICLFVAANTLLNKKMPLQIHPASMIFFSGSDFTRIFIRSTIIKKAFLYIISSITVGLILSGFKMNLRMVQIFTAMWNILMISLFTRHVFYHKGKNIKFGLILVIYVVVSIIQLYTNAYISLAALLLLSISTFKLNNIILSMALDFDKSYNEMTFINRASYVARHSMMPDMQQITREHMAQKAGKRTFKRELTRENALYYKNLLTFSRLNTQVLAILSAVQFIIIVLYKFKILESIDFIAEMNLVKPILILGISLFIMNIYEMLAQQKELLISKSKEGLYLPYSKASIIKSFVVLGIPIQIIETFLIGIILSRPLYIILLVTLLYISLLIISMYIKKDKKVGTRVLALNALILAASYILVG
jgi:hypothetical protein